MTLNNVQHRKQLSQQILGRNGEFSAYFRFYDDLVQRNSDFHVTINSSPPLQSVTDDAVLLAAGVLRSSFSRTLEETAEHCRLVAATDHNIQFHEKALSVALQAMFMIDPAAKENHSAEFTLGGYRPSSWKSDEALGSFIDRLFPLSLGSSQEAARVAVEYRALRARKLQQRLGARFRPTNNFAEHLLFDEKRNYLYVFHHVEFLRAQLGRYQSQADPLAVGLDKSLEQGTLPPQILVETLYTLQAVLFPPIDPGSAQILEELIERRGFDPECAEYEGYKVFRDPPASFQFVYWGDRMAHLHQLMTRRPPRNQLERWFNRHSTEGNALFIALLALFISILVGIVSIALNCVQIWMTWYTWKYTP
ncbi:hypothetical protein QBC34DRAFT_165136 [Podospora aff. communis PSN243]|uniref:Uncharacterized protein n=1 Tax=Podospora aff. communis PSN243 TaxID=3040156 RepID=A0AAV9GCW4_9PEZI|nr:hypothetical protein QBC34DRAFT_165136 [Podospora aff. communis PSN243]